MRTCDCPMCMMDRTGRIPKELPPERITFELVIVGAGIGFAIWATVGLFWAVGQVVSRFGLGAATLVACLGFGGLAGFWAATTGKR